MSASVKDKVPLPPSIYFGGCCFGAAFYIGVHRALVERYGADFYQHTLISGGSAGTMFAIGISLGKSPEYMYDLYKRVAEESHIRGPIRIAGVLAAEAIREMLDTPDAYQRLHGKCCIGTTEFFSKHRWHVSWESNDDLINCVKCSFHIPFYCEKVESMYGVEVLDGAYGFSGTDLTHGDETLYVGIDPHAEITRTFTNAEMFFPAVGASFEQMVESGYEAMMAWEGQMNRKVGHRRPNYEALYVLWTLKVIEFFVHLIYNNLLFLLMSLLLAVYCYYSGDVPRLVGDVSNVLLRWRQLFVGCLQQGLLVLNV